MRYRSILALLAALLLPVSPAGAEAKGEFHLVSFDQTAAWSGEVLVGALGVVEPLPEVCSPELCDTVLLDLAVPEGTWDTPGGMLVAIQWPTVDAEYDLDLFVYGPDGSLVASSSVWAFSRNEAAWIANPPNGRYTVLVMPKNTVGQPVLPGVLTPLEYEGFVRFQRGMTFVRMEENSGEPFPRTIVAFDVQAGDEPRALIPDIVPTQPRNFHIESTFGAQYYFYGDRGLRHQPSCYPWESAGVTSDDPSQTHPLRCLRWDQGEYNFGDGPFELHIYDGSNDVYQRIYHSDGSVTQVGPMGTTVFSQSHGHFHYVGWQEVKLYELNVDGTLGSAVRTGVAKGICMVDIENERFGRTDVPDAPLGFPVFGSCDASTHSDPNDPTFPGRSFFQMGISVGYADLYPWFIADQYIDVTGLPPRQYALVVRQDLKGRIREKNPDNNLAMGCVEIAGAVARDIGCTA